MRMIGKSADIVGGRVGAEFVQEQERIQRIEGRLADDARQPHAGAVAGRLPAQDARHRAGDAVGLDGGRHGDMLQKRYGSDREVI